MRNFERRKRIAPQVVSALSVFDTCSFKKKPMRKALTLFVIVVFSVAAVGAFVYYIGVRGLAGAIALNFMLMGCTLAFTETLKSPLVSSYFNEKTWEQRGKVYEAVGINYFRKFLVLVGWEKLNKKNNPVEKSMEALKTLHYKTKQNELGHILIFFIVCGFSVYTGVRFGIKEAVWLVVSNVVLNLYPILLQRYNRPRIERVIAVGKRRQAVAGNK